MVDLRQINVDSVPEFMKAILPTEPHFGEPPMFFRGQADASWGLVPSLWRAKSWKSLGGAKRHGLRIVDKGVEDGTHKVVDVGQLLLLTLRQVLHQQGFSPYPLNDDQLEALAQHIGLPTRLLDWTRSPLYAAYFAASDAVRRGYRSGRLSVYAMSRTYREISHLLERLDKPNAGGFGNPNLVAQQGAFIRVDPSSPDLLAGATKIELKIPYAMQGVQSVNLSNQFIDITLPHAHAPELLGVLRNQGIHAASLFPGHVGAGELVREVFRT